MSYRPEIDGLRAVAILVVVLYHCGLCPGGYTGVDVFFVISGYLISGLLQEEFRARRFSFSRFWTRRVRRLAPALLLVTASTGLLGLGLLLPRDLVELGQSITALWSLQANHFFFHHTGYFQGEAQSKPLLHCWSLAVEEQFYLLFPLLLSSARLRRPSGLLAVLLASLVWSTLRLQDHRTEVFYLLPGRAWELLLGAWVQSLPSPGRSELCSALGLLLMAISLGTFNPLTPFPGPLAAIPCLGSALFLLGNSQALTTSGRILAARPLVACGRVSYSWYLWHWPLLAFAHYWALGPVSVAVRLGLVVTALGLATASYRWLEQPIRSRRWLARTSALWTACGTGALALAVLGWWTGRAQGFPQRFSADTLRLAQTGAEQGRWPTLDHDAIARGNYAPMGAAGAGPIDFLLWGDSHCYHWFALLDESARGRGKRGLAAIYPATPPLLDYNSQRETGLRERSAAYSRAVLETIRRRNIRHVLLGARWNWKLLPREGYERALQRTLEQLERAGCEVWLLKQVPEQPYSVPRALARVARFGGSRENLGITLDEYRRQSAFFDQLVARHRQPHTRVLDPTGLFFHPGRRCALVYRDQALYLDSDHPTALVAEQLLPQLSPLWGP